MNNTEALPEALPSDDLEEGEDGDDWDDAITSPKDHGIFHVGDDWDFSPGFWD